MMAHLSPGASALAPSIIRQMSRRSGSETINLTLGQPARSPDQDLLEAALEVLRSGPSGYTETAGLIELRAAIAEHHCRGGEDEVIVTVGSEQAVYLALTCSVCPGDAVLVPEPGYPAYPGIVRLLGADAVPYPITREGGLVPRIEDLRALANERTRAVIWNAPSNPFGTLADAPTVKALLALCQEKGWTLISDEIYRDLVYDQKPLNSPSELQSAVLLVSGLSKSCALTGFRIGYLCGPSEFVRQATLAHQLMVTCAPRISQLMALKVFREPGRLRTHLADYARARAALSEAAAELPPQARLHLGDGAFYGTLDVERWAINGSLALALDLLEEEDVAVVPGVAFGASGDWFWRLSYAGGADSASEGLRRIAGFLHRRMTA